MAKVVSFEEAMPIIAAFFERRRSESEKPPVAYFSGNAGRLPDFERYFLKNASKFTGGRTLHAIQLLSLGPSEDWELAAAAGVVPVTPFVGPGVRGLFNRGIGHFLRSDLSMVPRLLSEGRWQPDIVFAHVSPPDNRGRVTLGLNSGLDHAPVTSAVRDKKKKRFAVAFVNKRMPRFCVNDVYDRFGRKYETGCAMYLEEFDLVIEIDARLTEHVMRPKAQGDAQKIAENIIAFLQRESGSTNRLPYVFQLGIGAIPDAFANELARLEIGVDGVHSDMGSNGMMALLDKHLIRNIDRSSSLHRKIVVGFVLGSNGLYELMHDNPLIAVLPQEIVNDPAVISMNEGLVSINSTMEMTFCGDIGAAAKATDRGPEWQGGPGGQRDFTQAAIWSRGGIPIIASPSVATLKDGTRESKIVRALSTPCTIPSFMPVVVITPNGTADLRGRDDRERVRAMLGVAHPDFRDELVRQASLLPSLQGLGAISPRIVSLLDGTIAEVRPATKYDLPLIEDYLRSFSREDIRSRFLHAIGQDEIVKERIAEWKKDDIDFKWHAVFVLTVDGKIVGVTHAYVNEERRCEVTFSRRTAYRGKGIGRLLMDAIDEWEKNASDPMKLEGGTFSDNSPMIELFRKSGFIESGVNQEGSGIVQYVREVDEEAEAAS